MKAVLIDSITETVSIVALPDTDKGRERLEAIYKLLNCTCIAAPYVFDNDDTLYVDDEGLLTLTKESKFFQLDGFEQPLAGNGIIIGTDDEGNSISAKSDLTEIKARIKFLTLKQVQKLLDL